MRVGGESPCKASIGKNMMTSLGAGPGDWGRMSKVQSSEIRDL